MRWLSIAGASASSMPTRVQPACLAKGIWPARDCCLQVRSRGRPKPAHPVTRLVPSLLDRSNRLRGGSDPRFVAESAALEHPPHPVTEEGRNNLRGGAVQLLDTGRALLIRAVGLAAQLCGLLSIGPSSIRLVCHGCTPVRSDSEAAAGPCRTCEQPPFCGPARLGRYVAVLLPGSVCCAPPCVALHLANDVSLGGAADIQNSPSQLAGTKVGRRGRGRTTWRGFATARCRWQLPDGGSLGHELGRLISQISPKAMKRIGQAVRTRLSPTSPCGPYQASGRALGADATTDYAIPRRYAWWGLLFFAVVIVTFGFTDLAIGPAADVGIPLALTGMTLEQLEAERAAANRLFDIFTRANGWSLACERPPLWRSFRAQCGGLVGDTGLEPVTSCMSSKCSNQLS